MNEKYMRRALELAEKGGCKTQPNPLVGCVIVKNGRVAGEGYHKKCGGAHAEINALSDAGRKASGASLYVNLEPCVHWGRTAPCVDSIISAGIKSAYFSMYDPNPLVKGRGEKKLKDAGIKVCRGLLRKEAEYLNREFIVNMERKRPYVLLKQAQTLDGKIATVTGDSKWISSAGSREYVHKLRSECQGILVGINTVLKDNPYLTSHGHGGSSARILIDKNLDIPLKSRFLNNDSDRIVITGTGADGIKARKIERKGAKVWKYNIRNNKFDLRLVLKDIYKYGIYKLLLESGGGLNWSFIKAGLVDEAVYFVAPKIIGGVNALTSVEGSGIARMDDAVKLKNVTVRQINDDIVVKGTVCSRG